MLLKERLNTLDLMKKQVEDSYTLDQSIVYNRFRIKLRRSEMAHARRMGNKDLMQQLQISTFLLNTNVTDDSGKAVRQILQASQREGSKSTGLCKPKATGLRSLKSARGARFTPEVCSDGKPEIPWAEEKDLQDDVDSTQCKWKGNGKGVSFTQLRPHTTKAPLSKETDLVMRPHTAAVTIQNNPDISSKLARPQKGRSPMPNVEIESGDMSSSPEETLPRASSRRTGEMKRLNRPDSKSLFMKTGVEVKKHSIAEVLITLNKGCDFGGRVSQFVDRVTELKQQPGQALSDYYSQRLLENFNRYTKKSRDMQLLLAMEEDQCKWGLVGTELTHTSITIRKLDRNFTRKDIPPEVLFLESYSALITKENKEERNWIANNPY
ncbi:UNVERIFIED_CONTAM: hypothetical protein FKN15_001846 [Acipenser sinensis]